MGRSAAADSAGRAFCGAAAPRKNVRVVGAGAARESAGAARGVSERRKRWAMAA